MTRPPTDAELDDIEESWRQGRPLPGAVRVVLSEIRRLRRENAELQATCDLQHHAIVHFTEAAAAAVEMIEGGRPKDS